MLNYTKGSNLQRNEQRATTTSPRELEACDALSDWGCGN